MYPVCEQPYTLPQVLAAVSSWMRQSNKPPSFSIGGTVVKTPLNKINLHKYPKFHSQSLLREISFHETGCWRSLWIEITILVHFRAAWIPFQSYILWWPLYQIKAPLESTHSQEHEIACHNGQRTLEHTQSRVTKPRPKKPFSTGNLRRDRTRIAVLLPEVCAQVWKELRLKTLPCFPQWEQQPPPSHSHVFQSMCSHLYTYIFKGYVPTCAYTFLWTKPRPLRNPADCYSQASGIATLKHDFRFGSWPIEI